MENTTKERILQEALICFAENGYKGTNLRDLAAQLGLSKSALYRHYTSKEEIWNAIIERMTAHYNAHFGSAEHLTPVPNSCEELAALAMGMVNFTMHDEQIILTRKMLLMAQFHDERAKKLATEHFLLGTKRIYTEIFRQMIAKELLVSCDPEMMALAFTAPITVLIHTCDREPEREPEIMREIEGFVQHFIRMYGRTQVDKSAGGSKQTN